ncbi:MAG: peptide ABC transporter substrate-binding protein, partial [Halioglobus sp.]|nr:peptide ABC transporter substrate-binding protein [Halioglobus sp.]
PYFISQLALPAAFPVHARSIAEHGDGFARAGKLISNGAYQLTSWELGSFIELTRNPYYWNNANTDIDRVRHHVTVEASAELYRYRAGELDITAVVPPEAYAQLARDRPDELRVAPFLGTYFYGFNLTGAKLRDNPKLRQALSMAIDRDVLTEKVTARGEKPAWGWVPPGVYNYESQRFSYADMPRAERHRMAQKLYREAGYGPENPLQIEVRYNTAETHERLALAVQSMWRDVLGFEATLINEEFRVLVANIHAMQLTEVFRLSWNGDYNDAYSFLSIFESGNPSNLTGYSNPEFDGLMQKAAEQVDAQSRRIYLEEAEREMLDDHPVVPLYFHVSKHLVNPRVRGWQDNVLDFHYSQHLSLRDSNDPE